MDTQQFRQMTTSEFIAFTEEFLKTIEAETWMNCHYSDSNLVEFKIAIIRYQIENLKLIINENFHQIMKEIQEIQHVTQSIENIMKSHSSNRQYAA